MEFMSAAPVKQDRYFHDLKRFFLTIITGAVLNAKKPAKLISNVANFERNQINKCIGSQEAKN